MEFRLLIIVLGGKRALLQEQIVEDDFVGRSPKEESRGEEGRKYDDNDFSVDITDFQDTQRSRSEERLICI